MPAIPEEKKRGDEDAIETEKKEDEAHSHSNKRTKIKTNFRGTSKQEEEEEEERTLIHYFSILCSHKLGDIISP